MYSRPEKIICILKESGMQSMNTVSMGVIKFGHPFKAFPILYDDFKTSPIPTSLFIQIS